MEKEIRYYNQLGFEIRYLSDWKRVDSDTGEIFFLYFPFWNPES